MLGAAGGRGYQVFHAAAPPPPPAPLPLPAQEPQPPAAQAAARAAPRLPRMALSGILASIFDS